MPPDAFFESATRGLFSVGAYWAGSCAMGPDILDQIGGWHSRYIVPLGSESSFNRDRYDDPVTDGLLDRLAAVSPESRDAAALGIEVLKQFVARMPSIQMFGTTQILPYSTRYWTNMPTDENPYGVPWSWWTNFKFLLPQLRQTGLAPEGSSVR
jgi:peptide/nickel transport system substrate-binding protein